MVVEPRKSQDAREVILNKKLCRVAGGFLDVMHCHLQRPFSLETCRDTLLAADATSTALGDRLVHAGCQRKRVFALRLIIVLKQGIISCCLMFKLSEIALGGIPSLCMGPLRASICAFGFGESVLSCDNLAAEITKVGHCKWCKLFCLE